MQFIFGGAAASSCSAVPKVVAPVVTDETLVIAAGGGDTAAPLFAGMPGDPAPYGGFVNKTLGCDAVKLVVSYLTGDDCDACTVDTLTVVTEEVTIPANAAGVALPPGYINSITAQVVDDTGLNKVSATGGSVRFTSSRAGACGADVLLPNLARVLTWEHTFTDVDSLVLGPQSGGDPLPPVLRNQSYTTGVTFTVAGMPVPYSLVQTDPTGTAVNVTTTSGTNFTTLVGSGVAIHVGFPDGTTVITTL